MTCTDCEENPHEFYIRVHVANVAVVACRRHATAVLTILNRHHEELSELAKKLEDEIVSEFREAGTK